jgi:hypothetical protein
MPQASLKPGWRVLKDTIADMLDPRFTEYDEGEQDRRRAVSIREIMVRSRDLIPAGQNQKLIDGVAAIANAEYHRGSPIGTVARWDDAMYDYVVNHGGEEAIDAIVAQNELMYHSLCPCGSGDRHVMIFPTLETKERYIAMSEGKNGVGLGSLLRDSGLLGLLLGGGLGIAVRPGNNLEEMLGGMGRGSLFGEEDEIDPSSRRHGSEGRRTGYPGDNDEEAYTGISFDPKSRDREFEPVEDRELAGAGV